MLRGGTSDLVSILKRYCFCSTLDFLFESAKATLSFDYIVTEKNVFLSSFCSIGFVQFIMIFHSIAMQKNSVSAL
jgi:hypothetical protein